MSNRESSQNYTSNGSDWHRADIVAALKKKGLSVRQLSRDSGLAENTLANTFRTPWPKGQKIIANAIGFEPEEIWPSRYLDLQKAG